MSGTSSPKQSSSSGSAASFIKGVEQLIQSDDDQVIMAKMNSLHSTFPVLKKINNQMTNGEKLVLFMRDHIFRHRLGEKLLQQFGSEKIPTIKVQVYSTRYRSVIEEELDESDLVKILQKFGKISILSVDKTFAYIRFQSLLSSYLAIQILNQFEIVSDLLRLSVRWCKPEEELLAEQLFSAKFNSITKAFGNHQASQKYNAKYQIHLACPPEFKLPQKIIGPKGNNMKKVFQSISQQHKIASIKELQKNLKLRLRGKGSGYSEGPDGEESDEILNLCVTAKEKKLYDSACIHIEKILQKLANDYKYEFERTYRRLLEGTIYKKYELQMDNYKLTNELKLEQLPNNLNEVDENRARKLTVKEIDQQINLRNMARKNGNYKEADQIRDRLKKKGILLVDGTGKKNYYATTWSYIGE